MNREDCTWENIKWLATNKIKQIVNPCDEYLKRLSFEFKEIEKQDATPYWVRLFHENYKYDTNKNGLVLPYALGMTKVDPMEFDHQIVTQTDYPDIDLDCISEAREAIKNYVTKKYGKEYVCGVGAWSTYKFKLAITDTMRALGGDVGTAMKLTKKLPLEVDDLKDGGRALCVKCDTKHGGVQCPKCGSVDTDGITIGQLLRDIPELAEFNDKAPMVVDLATKLVGRIKTQSQHAGGLIISNEPLFGNLPMALIGSGGNKKWTSMWTEGLAGSQLSKFGYIKWDILGLTTLKYISDCCKLIKNTKNHTFNVTPWEGMSVVDNRAGYYTDHNGVEHEIPLDDAAALKMADDKRTETIFQFETDVQSSVLSHGVKSFNDLQIYNAMGHPGPIKCVGSHSKIRTKEGHTLITELNCDTHPIAYVNKNNEIRHTHNYRIIHNGRKKILKLTTKSGKTLYVTPDHKIRTPQGYIRADKLNIGSKVSTIHTKSQENSQ